MLLCHTGYRTGQDECCSVTLDKGQDKTDIGPTNRIQDRNGRIIFCHNGYNKGQGECCSVTLDKGQDWTYNFLSQWIQ